VRNVKENYVKRMLRDGKKITGAWAQAASNITAEIMAEAGYDIVMIDHEHAPGTILTLISQIQALKGYEAVPFARAPWNDFVQIKLILDAGVYGLLIPYVNSKEEAEEAVRAVRYPTDGIRGVAGSPRGQHYGNNSMEYIRAANKEIFLMTAVETREAVENIAEIITVEGIDGIFIGPMDLASNLGHLGDASQPLVQEAIARIEKAVLNSGKVLATVAGSWEEAKNKYEKGYQILLLFSDTLSLGKAAREKVKLFNQYFPDR
jgi:2-dehydro-3-deoxyglucarate aldolase/4-hydroxy-2-oxoheptanedioate aldolase